MLLTPEEKMYLYSPVVLTGLETTLMDPNTFRKAPHRPASYKKGNTAIVRDVI